MRVVHGHAAHARESVHGAGLLVTVDRTELEESQRQFAVAALAGLIDQCVERAVHRLQVVQLAIVELHWRVHALGEPLQVTGRFEQVGLGDVGRIDKLVAARDVAGPRVVLHDATHRAALGMKDREARADLRGKRKEVELLTQSAVVAQLCLFELVQVCGQRLFGLPRGAVDALELRALLVAAPVRAGDAGQFEVTQVRGRGHVRTATEVDERRRI